MDLDVRDARMISSNSSTLDFLQTADFRGIGGSGGPLHRETHYVRGTVFESQGRLNSSKAAVHARFIHGWNRPSKAQLHLHGPAPVACQFEGRLHLVETVAARQQRLHVDGPPVDEVDGETELLVKSERPAHLDLLGDHRVLGNGYVTAEPELQQHAARLQHIETGTDRSLVAGCLELHVEITLICSVSAELLRLVRHVDGAVGSDLLRLLQHRVHHVSRHDFTRAVLTRGDDVQRADRTAAGDENALAQQRARTRHRMQGDGERLGKGSFVARDTLAHFVALPFLGHETLAECPLNMRHRHGAAVEAHVQALILQALQTVLAGIARPARGNGHPVADRKWGNADAGSLDRAGDLVAQNHRLANPHRTEAAVVEIVEIGAANAARLDSDLDLARPHFLRLAILDPQVARGVNDDGFHGFFSSDDGRDHCRTDGARSLNGNRASAVTD